VVAAASAGSELKSLEMNYWLRVFRLIGFACNVLGLLILGAVA
jgi:hypothetical protein